MLPVEVIACTMASITSGRRPSLKFGTHSTIRFIDAPPESLLRRATLDLVILFRLGPGRILRIRSPRFGEVAMFFLHRSIRQTVLTAALLALWVQLAGASDSDAVRISTNIQQFHMPYGTVLDPVFASSDPNSSDYFRIVSYSRAGDSAIWTGHYLAAEAFRYRVTGSGEALDN